MTVPEAAALIGVPFGADISKPVCAELLILLLAPNLEVIVPEIGLINEIPSDVFPLEVVVLVFTYPAEALEEVFCATFTSFFFSTYNLDTTSSTETKSFIPVSYFSNIEILSIFSLFFSFNVLTTFSASSNEDT